MWRTDRIRRGMIGTAVCTAPALVAALFLWMLIDLLVRGGSTFVAAGGIGDSFVNVWRFLIDSPERAGRGGGVGPILISTSLILGVCLAAALPLGLGTALLLSEFVAEESRFGRVIRRSLDGLAGVPSIVFGLFGNAFFSQLLGLGFSILSGGLTLACMVLPLLVRAAEEALRAVPAEQRHAAAALGLTHSSTVFRVVMPQAIGGIVVGLILGIGRALAETAALIFTSGYVDRMPGSLFDSGRSLSIHIFDLAMNVAGGNANAYASALVLVVMLVVINEAARWLANRFLRRGWLTA